MESFLQNLGFYIAVDQGLLPPHPQPFQTERAQRAWEAAHAVDIDVSRLRFYSSLRAVSAKHNAMRRRYAFTVVAAEVYRGHRRFDDILLNAGEGQDPFVAKALSFLSYDYSESCR